MFWWQTASIQRVFGLNTDVLEQQPPRRKDTGGRALGRLCTAEQEGGKVAMVPGKGSAGGLCPGSTVSCGHCHPWFCPSPPSLCAGAACPLPWALLPGCLLSARMKLLPEGEIPCSNIVFLLVTLKLSPSRSKVHVGPVKFGSPREDCCLPSESLFYPGLPTLPR